MEQRDLFTFNNRGITVWLLVVGVLAATVAFVAAPAFWMCIAGAGLVAIGGIAHSARTGQWFTWQDWEPRFNWFEGWSGSTGLLLMAMPLLVAILKGLA